MVQSFSLCPGVIRANGEKTPKYESVYVFTNDFSALMEDVPLPPQNNDPLFQMGGNERSFIFEKNNTNKVQVNVFIGTFRCKRHVSCYVFSSKVK